MKFKVGDYVICIKRENNLTDKVKLNGIYRVSKTYENFHRDVGDIVDLENIVQTELYESQFDFAPGKYLRYLRVFDAELDKLIND